MSSCIIRLDQVQDQYYPGESVVGKVVCSFSTAKHIEEIEIYLTGEEHTGWIDNEPGKQDNIIFSGDNTFLKLEKICPVRGDLEPGEHKFPFKLDLPNSLPSTYHGKYGSVKYFIRATVVGNGNGNGDMKAIKVMAPIDFNDRCDLPLLPVTYSEEQMVYSWCCGNSLVSINVYLEKEAFVLGEVAKVKVKIINNSYNGISRIQAKIGMIVESKVTYPSYGSKCNLEELTATTHEIPTSEEYTHIFNLHLPISATVPNFTLCKLFSHSCNLEVIAILMGWSNNIVVGGNVVVGHIPLGEHSQKASIVQKGYSLAEHRCPQRPVLGIRNSPAVSPNRLKKPKQPTSISDNPTSYLLEMNGNIPYPPDRRQPIHRNSAPYPPDKNLPILSSNTPTKKKDVDSPVALKSIISVSLGTPTPYPPIKPYLTYPPDDNRTPFAPKVLNPQDAYAPPTQDQYPNKSHTPPNPSYDKPESITCKPPILLSTGRPVPYRRYDTRDNSTQYAPEESKPPFPPKRTCAANPSAIPHLPYLLDKSNPPYPLVTPYPPKKLNVYPPDSNPSLYPYEMPKPERSFLNHTPPYLTNQSKTPYPSGFKPSYLSDNYQIPYPLDEAKHPHPVPLNSRNTSYPSSDNNALNPSDIEPPLSPKSALLIFSMPRQKSPIRCDSIGFAVPSSVSSTSDTLDVPLSIPMPLPYAATPFPTHEPSAPPLESESSDQHLNEIAETNPLIEDSTEMTPPPTYKKAISSTTTVQLTETSLL